MDNNAPENLIEDGQGLMDMRDLSADALNDLSPYELYEAVRAGQFGNDMFRGL